MWRREYVRELICQGVEMLRRGDIRE